MWWDFGNLIVDIDLASPDVELVKFIRPNVPKRNLKSRKKVSAVTITDISAVFVA